MPSARLPGRLHAGSLIGMVHVAALPSSPGARLAVREIARRAAAEAKVLKGAGFDAVLIENMHDTPYAAGRQDPAVTAAMTAAAVEARRAVGDGMPLGVQVLAWGNIEALAVAHAAGLDFVRVEGFVFSHVADEGVQSRACAAEVMRYRRAIGAKGVAVFADIQKKHASHALTADLPIEDHAHAAEFFNADGVIVTGTATGRAPVAGDLKSVRSACSLPVLVGSGATAENVRSLLMLADGVIVGSSIKRGGSWKNPVDEARAKLFVKAARGR